jgi:hypothetical protein
MATSVKDCALRFVKQKRTRTNVPQLPILHVQNLSFDFMIDYFNSKTTTENAGIFNVRVDPEIAAPVKTAGLTFSGLSNEL